MSKHTPAPWTLIATEEVSAPQIIAVGKHDICTMDGSASHQGVMADARLIAAAPELLEALKDAELRMRSYLVLHKCDDEFIAKETAIARAAIAKATEEKA